MEIISSFWLSLLEAIYLPVYEFYGSYSALLTFIVLVLFIAFQIWLFWHLFLKPFIYMAKIFINLVFKNTMWKEVEVDED